VGDYTTIIFKEEVDHCKREISITTDIAGHTLSDLFAEAIIPMLYAAGYNDQTIQDYLNNEVIE